MMQQSNGVVNEEHNVLDSDQSDDDMFETPSDSIPQMWKQSQ